jgi:hypothetical protein
MPSLFATAVLMRQFDQSSAVTVVYALLLLAAAASETVAFLRTRSPISAATAGMCWGLLVIQILVGLVKN